jgi:ABC-2 type transport system ATP-binding protein
MTRGSFAIQTQNLHKVFGNKIAVRNLSLTVERGEIFGFLGPNGAGKSTSIKMLLDLVRPTSGEATVLGAPVGDVEVRRKIGFLPEDFRFYEWLTPTELLHLHGRLCGVSASELKTRVPFFIDLVGLVISISKVVIEGGKFFVIVGVFLCLFSGGANVNCLLQI